MVIITQTHTTEPKVTIESDDRVKVAADAPAGTHTMKYKITEKGQTTASAEVEVKVAVTNKIELDHTAVISNPVTPSTDNTTPKEIGNVLDGTKLNSTRPTIGTGPNQVRITVTDPADPQVGGAPVPCAGISYALFLSTESALQPEGLLHTRGIAGSGFPPLSNIPHCCLP